MARSSSYSTGSRSSDSRLIKAESILALPTWNPFEQPVLQLITSGHSAQAVSTNGQYRSLKDGVRTNTIMSLPVLEELDILSHRISFQAASMFYHYTTAKHYRKNVQSDHVLPTRELLEKTNIELMMILSGVFEQPIYAVARRNGLLSSRQLGYRRHTVEAMRFASQLISKLLSPEQSKLAHTTFNSRTWQFSSNALEPALRENINIFLEPSELSELLLTFVPAGKWLVSEVTVDANLSHCPVCRPSSSGN